MQSHEFEKKDLSRCFSGRDDAQLFLEIPEHKVRSFIENPVFFFRKSGEKTGDEGFKTGIIRLDSDAAVNPAKYTNDTYRFSVFNRRELSSARLKRLAQEDASPRPDDLRKPRVLFIVSNGTGLGHVMRSASLLKTIEGNAQCRVLSLSAAADVLTDVAGAQNVTHCPSPQYLALEGEAARRFLFHAVHTAVKEFRPDAIVYDGNILPSGLLAALSAHPAVGLAWVRRGMWRADIKRRYMATQALADMVIEPGELAGDYDEGPSWQQRDKYCPPRRFVRTAPFTMSAHVGFHGKAHARKILGLPTDKRCVLVQLGAGNQDADDFHRMQDAVISSLKRHSDIISVLAHWPMSHRPPPQRTDGVHVIEVMPLLPCIYAFDAVISAAGYNSFHELIQTGVPTLFIPREDTQADRQVARAQYAADKGLARVYRWAEDKGRNLDAAVDAAISGDIKKPQGDVTFDMVGGQEAATHILELARGRILENTRTPVVTISAADEDGQKEGGADLCRRWNARMQNPVKAQKAGNIAMLILDGSSEINAEKLKALQDEYARQSGLELFVICPARHAILMRRSGLRYMCMENISPRIVSGCIAFFRPKKIEFVS